MDAPVAGTRPEASEEIDWSWKDNNNEYTWGVVDELLAVARETGKTPAQVALNWLSQRSCVTAPIVGADTPGQLRENLGAVGWKLSPEDMQRLNRVSELDAPYPYYMIAKAQTLR
jgi:aryl-alcohol dehydrogenase-like predicted oxidoreductase